MPEPLASYTTLRLGGLADDFVEVGTTEEYVAELARADHELTPLLILGGGSNVVIGDDGFRGRVLLVRTRGRTVDADACSGTTLTIAAGEVWDDVVVEAVAREWVGIEALSGIPGSAGATPIQNVGAYGQEIADTVARVVTWDRYEGKRQTFTADRCGFGYRTSRFKREPGRYAVLEVVLQLPWGDQSAPIRYAELARSLGVEPGSRAPLGAVRDAVLALRRSKGMVLDPDDHDTWSAGSFFTNPIVPVEQVPEGAPAFAQADQPDGIVKTSAAWLIEHAGFDKGYPSADAPVSLSTKHTLALTNRGAATTADLLALAREVRDGVRNRFGIELVPEPVLVGCGF